MLNEIAKYIANKTSFVLGNTLQVGTILQTAPQTCVAIIDDVGGKPDFHLKDVKMTVIHFVSRSENQETARNNAYDIYGLFHGKATIDLPVVTAGKEYRIRIAEAQSTPTYEGMDDKRVAQYNLYILFDVKDKNT